MLREVDTCRNHVVPALDSAGWKNDLIAEQHPSTDGRISVAGQRGTCGERTYAGYLDTLRTNVDALQPPSVRNRRWIACPPTHRARPSARRRGHPYQRGRSTGRRR